MNITTINGYEEFLRDLKARIRTAQVRAALAVNSELVLLYWQIGRDILTRQEQEGWGAKVVERLAADLRREFPDMKGFSPRNLKYMRAFAESWPDAEFVQEVLAQITWFSNITVLDKVKQPNEREWYIKKAIEHGWSRNVLVHQIESGLIHRQGKAITNFHATLPIPQSDLANEMLKDLNKPVGVSEYQLVAAIPENLKGNLPTVEELEAELSEIGVVEGGKDF